LSVEDELKQLARSREEIFERDLAQMDLESPDLLMRKLRHYLAIQVDRRRLKSSNDHMVRLETVAGGDKELVCPGVKFLSDAQLNFKVHLQPRQPSYVVRQFQFHLRLSGGRNINMVRIHLNDGAAHEPERVPRCHLHIGDSRAHVPFPIMNPLLTLYLICEHIEPDFGLDAEG